MTVGYFFRIQERGTGRKEFLRRIRCEHYEKDRCTLFGKCSFPDCKYYVTVEEC